MDLIKVAEEAFATGKQSAKIDYSIAKRKLMAHIVDSSQANEQHRPH